MWTLNTLFIYFLVLKKIKLRLKVSKNSDILRGISELRTRWDRQFFRISELRIFFGILGLKFIFWACWDADYFSGSQILDYFLAFRNSVYFPDLLGHNPFFSRNQNLECFSTSKNSDIYLVLRNPVFFFFFSDLPWRRLIFEISERRIF